MNREKRRAVAGQQNVFGAVAVVNIKIKDGDAFDSGGQRLECRDRDVAEITKAHDAVARGVMPGRTHEAENGFATARAMHCYEGGAYGRARVIGDTRIC